MIDCRKCFYLCKRYPGSGFKPLETCPYYWPEEVVTAKMTLDRMQGIELDRWDYLSVHNQEVERNMDKINPEEYII